MSDGKVQIQPSTKVAQLLEAYPELGEVLIRMAPPFKKLNSATRLLRVRDRTALPVRPRSS